MTALFLHDHARGDLDELWEKDEVAAADIEVFLQEAAESNEILESLTDHDFGEYGTEPYHVNKWQEMWRQRIDLWRVKLWSLEGQGIQYRIIYAYIVGESNFYVLAIAPRSFNYDRNHDLTKRILADYADLKF